jgi:NADPH:quinone reductase
MPKAVRFYEFGGPEVLKLEEVALQRPDRREVRLKIEACALNRADILLREDRHAVKVTAFPSPIGYEASGIIDGVGEDISEFKVGDRVNTVPVGMHHCLCAESAVLPVEAVSSYPETLTPIEATSVWMQYLTAWGALIEYGALRATDTVVVSAASSSAGVGAIQLLKDAGARSIATTTSPSKEASPTQDRSRSCDCHQRGEFRRSGNENNEWAGRTTHLRPDRWRFHFSVREGAC